MLILMRDTLFFLAVDVQAVLLQSFFGELDVALRALVDEVLLVQRCRHGSYNKL